MNDKTAEEVLAKWDIKVKWHEWLWYRIVSLFSTIKHYPRYFFEHCRWGFDSRDTWQLDETIAKFAVSRLKVFRRVNNGFPNELTEEQWNTTLDEMIWALEMVAEQKHTTDDTIDMKRMQQGLELFGKYFTHLWW